MPGTWVNGLVADAKGSIWLTRNKVQALFAVTSDGIVEGAELELPPSGLRLTGGEPLPFSVDAGAARPSSDRDGPPIPAVEAEAGDCKVSLLVNDGEVLAKSDSETISLPGVRLLPHDLAGSIRGGRHVALGLKAEAEIGIFDCNSSELRLFDLPSNQEIPDGGGSSEGVPVRAASQPDAVAISPGGALAYSTDQGVLALIP